MSLGCPYSLQHWHFQCLYCIGDDALPLHERRHVLGNLTSTGWARTELDSDLDPVLGTGLALHPLHRIGLSDQINLFYQKSDLNLSLASWKPTSINNGGASLGSPVEALLMTWIERRLVGQRTDPQSSHSWNFHRRCFFLREPLHRLRKLDRSAVPFQSRDRSRYMVRSNQRLAATTIHKSFSDGQFDK